MSGTIYIGPAGWSYADWKGIVYSQRGAVDELKLLCSMFDAIEVNGTFYRPPTESMTRSWIERVAANPRFLFTLKLFRRFTHERDKLEPGDEAAFKKGLEPLAAAGKLGALLLQFPYSFHNTPENKSILVDIFRRFRDYPLVLEIRHKSWNTATVMESLARHGVGFCNVDQPNISHSIPRTDHATSKVAYLRLHGRNRGQWFQQDAGAERYNYLYSLEELREMVPMIRGLESRTDTIFIITNNHFAGQAVTNALQLQHLATGRTPSPPETLVTRYPQLGELFSASKTAAD